MQTLTFDAHGYITPSEKITVDLETLKHYFVDAFPESKTRKTLFDNYLRYLDAFAKEITPHFTQWLNGSFVTQKENPKDIDFVTFIDADLYSQKEKLIEKYWTIETYDIGLDGYFVRIFDESHQKFMSETQKFSSDWLRRYTNTKLDADLMIFSKGFLEIKFT